MLQIFRYLKQSIGPVLLIVGLLIIQAVCDLSLPTYTSNLVDVGISKKGIEETIPDKIRESELKKIELFLEDDEIEILEDAYTKTADKVEEDVIYELTGDESQQEEVKSAVEDPILLLGMIASMSDENGNLTVSEDSDFSAMGDSKELTKMMQMLFDEKTPKGTRIQMLDQIMEQFGDLKDTMSEQMSASYIEQEYDIIGVDMEDYQIQYLIHTGAKMLGVSLIVLVATILVGFLASQIAAKTAMNLRNGVFNKVVHFSNAEMDNFSTASLITRNTNDVQQIQMVLVMLLRMVLYAPILGIGGILKVIDTNVSMSWIIVAAVATVMCLVLFLFAIAMPKFKLMQTLVDKVNLVSREILTGLPVIRAFSTEKHEEERFDKANIELADTQLFTNRVMTFMMPAMMFLMNLVSVAIIWFGGKGIDTGTLTVGEMMAFLTYAMQIIMSFLMITMISIMLPRAGVAAKRINEVIDTPITIKDKEDTKSILLKDTKKSGVVEFENVSFSYPNAENEVISNISFRAKPGETTAFIGSTGSGKSTLINLIPRFYDVTKGKVSIDGVDVRDMKLKELRDMLGYVPQKGVLFSGTIASNIKYGAPNLNEEQVERAARIAQSLEFIETKAKKYDTEISQGGTNVSGGQKQRLSIARAIAKDPKIYIFDDSFSALDFKTDAALRKALKEETGDSTVLIVAQRISTILHADQIIVLDEGTVVGIGTHEELLKNCEVYQQIAASQLSEKEIKKSLGKEDE